LGEAHSGPEWWAKMNMGWETGEGMALVLKQNVKPWQLHALLTVNVTEEGSGG